MKYLYTKGFTLFYALLVSSLALSIGAAIFDITIREIQLSGAVTQSQYAVYAADTGSECALYWDSKCSKAGCNTASSAYATSSASTPVPANSGFLCGGVDITAAASNWTTVSNVSSATTTFTIASTAFHNQTPCAVVQVVKAGNPSVTTILSQGFNTCTAGPLQLERILQISY